MVESPAGWAVDDRHLVLKAFEMALAPRESDVRFLTIQTGGRHANEDL
jgi:hypothetical protein